MKKPILKIASTSFLVITLLVSCSTPAEKVDKAQENVTKANNELDSAIKDYLADIDVYRLETANRIAENEKNIASYNASIAKIKMDERAEYIKKIKSLELQNAALKTKLDNYKPDGDDKWKIFKAEFSKEMDDLGKSIKDLTKKDD